MEIENNNVAKTHNLSDKDWLLQTAINLVNDPKHNFGTDITLLCHGFLVSGQLISIQDYLKRVGEEFDNAFQKLEMKTSIVDVYEEIGKNLSSKLDNSMTSDYIHLSGAKFYTTAGNPVIGGGGALWRGRLREIAGFFYGSIQTV